MFNILQEVVSKVTDTTSCTRSEKYSSKLGILCKPEACAEGSPRISNVLKMDF